LHALLQEPEGDPGLLLEALGSKVVRVAALVGIIAEVVDLDPAAAHDGAQAVVDLAQADTELARELALTAVRISLQRLEQAIADFIRIRHDDPVTAGSGSGPLRSRDE